MSRPVAPSMPTARQIADALKAVKELHPGARIKSVGPSGVVFDYSETKAPVDEWDGKPFTGDF